MPAPQTASTTYTNPLGDILMGDPFALRLSDELTARYGARYYLFGTAGRGGFACWSSPDLVHWTSCGLASTRTPQTWGQTNFWAPEVVRYRDKFVMVYSAQHERDQGYRLCIASADAPAGPFVDLHAPWLDIGWSTIDADLFIDDDGAPYIFFDKVGVISDPTTDPPKRQLYGVIYGARLTDDLSAMIGEPVQCSEADQPWELVERARVLCNEGAYVLRRGGLYYMTYSSGVYSSPAYGIGYNTAKSPLGPWTKSPANPLARTDATIGISGPGHNNVTTSPDGKELFVVYHAHADAARPGAARNVNIDRMVIEEDGALKLIGPTRTPQPLPSGWPTANSSLATDKGG